jgi:type IX secretion system PorP/SprF family membrane protein
LHISTRISNICSKTVWLLIVLLCAEPAFSQQLPRFSQYSSNEFIFNPSVAGYDGRTVFNLAARKQWMGFADYTPSSYLISLQGRILKSGYSIKSGEHGKPNFKKANKGRVGLGGIIYHDVNGAVERTGAQFSYAYHVFVKNSQISMGLSGSIYQYRINKDRAELKNPDDDPLNGLIGKSTLVPDANFGINYMSERYHIGFAVNQIFQSKLKLGNNGDFKDSEETRLLRHYYLIADYRFTSTATAKWEWEPSVLILLNERLDKQAELTIKGYYKRQYWFGLAGRTCGDVIVMAGLKLHRYYFGYSYDYGFNGIARYTYGTHEISISAKFGDTARRYRWLDRY